MKPCISIFIPVYNGEQYIVRTLDSIIQQTYTDFEVLCVNDTSTDRSLEILEHYALTDKRVRIFTKPNEGDVPHSWVFVLPHLQGDYVLYLSQDDYLSPDLLENLFRRAQETGAEITIPDVVYVHNHSNQLRVGLFGDREVILEGRAAFLYAIRLQIAGFALRRSDIVRAAGVDTLAANSDELAQFKCLLLSRKVAFSEGIIYCNQTNPEAITKQFSFKRFSWCITAGRVLALLYEEKFDQTAIVDYTYRYWGQLFYLQTLSLKHAAQLTPDQRIKGRNMLLACYKEIDFRIFARHYGWKGKLIKLLFTHGELLIRVAGKCNLWINGKKLH